MKHLFNYKWYLKDGYPAPNITKNNYNVFGTFVCGGGSTMGYKLAGFNHYGGVEIDKRIADVYKENHKPKYFYNCDIRDFNKLNDLPKELYNLDILDGSPPCSSFSMAGNREKDWGKSKQFKEGQKKQVLDDLVFVYCETILKLKPKVFLLENVKGLIQGNAKLYVKQIVEKLSIDYKVQIFLLNAASMGVPQRRERVFIIGHKKEFVLPKLKLEFNEQSINFDNIYETNENNDLSPNELYLWNNKQNGDLDLGAINLRLGNKQNSFTTKLLHKKNICNTIASGGSYILFDIPRKLTNKELNLIGSFPLDYNFKDIQTQYLIGMSVPPVMTAQIANKIKIQWLDKL